MESETLITDQHSEKMVKDKEVGISKGTEEDIACTVAKVGGEEEKSGTSEHVESECPEIAAAEPNGKVNDNSKDETTPIEKKKQNKEEFQVVEGPIGTDTVESTETSACLGEKDHEKRIEEEAAKNSDRKVPIEAEGVEEVIEKDASDVKAHDDEKCEELQVGNGKKEEDEESKDFSVSEVLDSTTKVEEQQIKECKLEAPLGTDAFESTDNEKRIEEDIKNSDSNVPIEAKGVEEGIEKDVSNGKVHDKEKCEILLVDNGKKEEKEGESKDFSGSEVLASTTEVESPLGTDAAESTIREKIIEEEDNKNSDSEVPIEAKGAEKDGSDSKSHGEKCEELQAYNGKNEEESKDSGSEVPAFTTKVEEEIVVTSSNADEKKKCASEISETIATGSYTKEENKKEEMTSVEEVKSRDEHSDDSCSQPVLVTKPEEENVETIPTVGEEKDEAFKEVEGESDKTNSTCGEESKKEDIGKITFAEELLKAKIAEGKVSPTASITKLVNELVTIENKDVKDQTEVLAKEVPPSVVQVPPLTETETVEEEKRVEASNTEHVKEHDEEEKELKVKEKELTEHEHVTVKTAEGDHEGHHSSSKHGHQGIMSKVKHSISKVKKKILGKSSSTKATSSDNKEEN